MGLLHDWRNRARWVYLAYRHALMSWKRWRYGLRHVHPTFHMSGRSHVCRDLVAFEYAYIGPDCTIGPRVELGPYVMLASRVAITGGDHRFDVPGVPMIFAGREAIRPTVVEADAWIGHAAIVKAGVRVGRGSIVGAGSVVTRDVPPYEVHAGVPARKIGERFPDPADRERHEAMLRQPPRRGHYAMPPEDAPRPAAAAAAGTSTAPQP